MKAKRVVIWGTFVDYEEYRPMFKIEELKGNIEIAAVMFLDEDVVQRIDGYQVVKAEALPALDADYIVGLENELLSDMHKILEMLGIAEERLVPGRCFKLPDFDFARYLKVRGSGISIVSDNCWGGLTYHALGMKFTSPFINMFMEERDYVRLAQKLPEYMAKELAYVRNEYNKELKKEYPVCALGDVLLYCNHYDSYEHAKQIWDERKSRMNYGNILVKMMIHTEEELREFEKIPYRKVGFSLVPSEHPEVIDCSSVAESGYLESAHHGNFWEFVNWQARYERVELKYYNVLKLLDGAKDYRRI